MKRITAIVLFWGCCGGCSDQGEAMESESEAESEGETGFLYVWAGPRRAGDGLDKPPGNDVLVTVDLATRRAIGVLDVGSANNEPHHVMRCGARLFAGGLFSGRIFVFDVSQPETPTLEATIEGAEAGLGVADDFLCLPDGRVIATMMGSDTGGSPGGLLEIAPDLTVGDAWPTTPPPDLNPHGIDVDLEGGRLVTTDLMELASVASDPPAPVVRATVRIWDLDSHEITDTVEVCTGPMEARFLPDDPEGRILVCCMVSGEFGVVSRDSTGAYRYDASLDIDGTDDLVASPGGIHLADNTLWVALSGYGEVRRYDLDDPLAPTQSGTAIVGSGAHYMTFDDDARGYVSDYVVQRLESVTGMSAPDLRVWRFFADTDGMESEVVMDFGPSGEDALLADRLPLQPHGIALGE